MPKPPSPALALAVALLVPLLVSGKRKEVSVIGFHLEVEESEPIKGTTRVIVDRETFRVRKAPEFSQSDITGYYPFLSKDGTSHGAAFRLGQQATQKLHALSEKAAGRKLLTVVNADTIAYVIIDGTVDDNYIICWRGLSKNHLAAFELAGFEKIQAQGDSPAADERTDDFLPIPGQGGEPPLPGS